MASNAASYLEQSVNRFQIIRQYKRWHDEFRCTFPELMNVIYLEIQTMKDTASQLGFTQIYRLCEEILEDLHTLPKETGLPDAEFLNIIEMLQTLESEIQRLIALQYK